MFAGQQLISMPTNHGCKVRTQYRLWTCNRAALRLCLRSQRGSNPQCIQTECGFAGSNSGKPRQTTVTGHGEQLAQTQLTLTNRGTTHANAVTTRCKRSIITDSNRWHNDAQVLSHLAAHGLDAFQNRRRIASTGKFYERRANFHLKWLNR